MATNIKTFFDTRTYTLTYVVWDPETKDAVVIDPVLDYEPVGSKVWTESVDDVLAFLQDNDLNLHYVLETHAHADHLSGSQWIKEVYPDAKSAIGERITTVQEVFKGVFDLPEEFATDGSQFDELLGDGQVVHAGSIPVEVIFTPGHTPACATYKIEDAIFTGDALFMPDVGTGRCDFPAGSSSDIYDSIVERLYTLPDDTRVFVGHDYPEGRGREAAWETTVGESKETNVALPASRDRDDFVAWRDNRDSGLAAPRLLFQSVQVNVDAGRLPEPHANEMRYLRIPINVFRPVPNPNAEIVEEAV
jgi:glyoxylase-like metal-dependent hydrolase (beta-lactamase superfamily II)